MSYFPFSYVIPFLLFTIDSLTETREDIGLSETDETGSCVMNSGGRQRNRRFTTIVDTTFQHDVTDDPSSTRLLPRLSEDLVFTTMGWGFERTLSSGSRGLYKESRGWGVVVKKYLRPKVTYILFNQVDQSGSDPQRSLDPQLPSYGVTENRLRRSRRTRTMTLYPTISGGGSLRCSYFC